MFPADFPTQLLRIEWDHLGRANDHMTACGLSEQANFGRFLDVLLFESSILFRFSVSMDILVSSFPEVNHPT